MVSFVVWRLKQLFQAALRKTGYRLVRLPPLASSPEHALPVGLDFVLAHYLQRRADPRPFFFVQIGAFDGMVDDPIYQHVQPRGWHGVLVEPQRRYFEQLERNYASCEGLTFVRAAVSKERETKPLYVVSDTEGLPDVAGAIASFSLETIRRWRSVIPEIEGRITTELVECITFADLLERARVEYIDLLQIDVEGDDFEILKLVDFSVLRPAIVRFEHLLLSREDYDAAVGMLADAGYRVLREVKDTTAYLWPPE